MAVNFNTLGTASDDNAVVAAINSLHRRGDNLQLDIHKVLVAIGSRWAASGDVRPAVKHVNLLLAKDRLGGVRKNAIRSWVETFLGFVYIEEGDDKGNFTAGKLKHTGLQLKELANHRWWEFKAEPAYKPMDFDAMFSSLVQKAEKRAGLAKADDNVDPGLIAALKAARDNYMSQNVAH